MKTKLSFLFLVGMLFSISIFASDPETTTYSNIQNTETGSIKEFTTFRANSTEPIQKSTYRYDLAGNIQEKVVYKEEETYIKTISDKGLTLELSDTLMAVMEYLKWTSNPRNVPHLVLMMYYLQRLGRIKIEDFTIDMKNLLEIKDYNKFYNNRISPNSIYTII